MAKNYSKSQKVSDCNDVTDKENYSSTKSKNSASDKGTSKSDASDCNSKSGTSKKDSSKY